MDWVLDEWGNDGKSYIKWDALNEVCAGVSEDGAFCTFPHAFIQADGSFLHLPSISMGKITHEHYF